MVWAPILQEIVLVQHMKEEKKTRMVIAPPNLIRQE
jgi:hypothetical protein